MPATPGDLQAILEEFLAAAEDSLDTIPLATGLDDLEGAPERAFVSPGAPVPDCCPQLGVYAQQVTSYAAGTKGNTPRLPSVNLVGVLHRCVPGGTGEGDKYRPPTAAAQQASARQLHADGWALWNHIWNMIHAGQFLEQCQNVIFESLTSIPQAGGCAGWQLVVRVQVDGYAEELGT